MNIQVTARHQKFSKDEKEALKSQFSKIEKFAEKITSCHIIVDHEHVEQTVEAVVNVQRQTISAKAKGPTTLAAADHTLQKIERQLKKINDKVKNHKAPKEPAPLKEEDAEE